MPGGKFAGLANGAVGAIGGIGINNVRAIGAQNLFALGGNILRHAQGDGKSFSRSEHGVGDAGVAAGGIEQNFAGSENWPLRRPSATMLAAARSFTEPPGLCHSALPKSVTPGRCAVS